VEELYWRLVQARRDVTITARIIADFEVIYDYLEARQEFDITPVQLASTRASLEQSRTEFILREADVYDAEDRLVAAMNSEDIDLADDIEIIPTDVPRLDPVVLDRLSEVQTALDYRQEIHEQELRVANAKIAVGRAANLELPRLDLSFRTTYDGLGISADDSFDQLTQGDFIEYFVGVEFEYPIGNRGPRAASRRSRLQQQQQVAELKRVIEEVILDTNLAVRRVSTAYDAIPPSFETAEAREREVDSIVARAERKDFVVLNQELGARQSLAAARRTMLSAMVEYNISIIDLERAKGTLLEYYNVVVPTDDCAFPAPPVMTP
jgi:outer membrane protein TolC